MREELVVGHRKLTGRIRLSPRFQRPAIPLVVGVGEEKPDLVKIGDAARYLGTSVQTIRLYEIEGLLISLKSKAGTRWYGREDLFWISHLKDLLSDGLNFVGIRRLLAQIPCWELKPCTAETRSKCSMRFEARMPCWMAPDRLCEARLPECYHCNTYRRACEFTNLKSNARILPVNSANA